MLRRKFAVIKLWPELKTAEDECIARLKSAARLLGIECVEVDSFARLVHPPHAQLTQEDVDFVLSLHFETPKRYDIFSFVALWNPLEFYHDWGYRRFTNHLLTHDDFLSCSSSWADDHIRRLVADDPMRDGPCLQLHHSLAEPVLVPTTGDKKLFYVGINWEQCASKPARHQGLLKLLDKSGDLRIYGPKIFQGVDVWAGYESYVGPIAFDGVSVVREIHKAGISLVLSSEAHQQSELMSSRLFESLAAGAVIICNENRFARRFFGDALLYIDTSLPAEETYAQVQNHIDWIKSNPTESLKLAGQAQGIFRKEFTLDGQLKALYENFPARKEKLARLYQPRTADEKIALLFLMPEYQPEVLEQHIASCLAQKHVDIRPIVLMDRRDEQLFGHRLRDRLARLAVPMTISVLDFFERYPDGSVKQTKRLGQIISEAIRQFARDAYLCIVGPNERLFSDHLCALLRVLQDRDEAGAAWSDILFAHKDDGKDYADLSDGLSLNTFASNQPLGIGRFLLRSSAFEPDLHTALPYLNSLAMHLLVGVTKSAASKRCTLMLDIQAPFNVCFNEGNADREREILIDYAPDVFGQKELAPVREVARQSAIGVLDEINAIARLQAIEAALTHVHEMNVSARLDHLERTSLSTERMDPEQKAKLAVELAHSVPLPGFLKRIGFFLYRIWFRRQNASA